MHTFSPPRFLRLMILVASLAGVLLISCPRTFAQRMAKDATEPAARKSTVDSPASDCPEAAVLRKNVAQLSAEVQRLTRKVTDLEKELLPFSLQEQLENEEQRGERLQLHLIEIGEKESPLLARMDQINQQVRPETIERAMAGVGSVHPEDAREEVRKRLANEKIRIQSQLDLLRQDRIRTQASLATTDAAILRLKQKLAEALRK